MDGIRGRRPLQFAPLQTKTGIPGKREGEHCGTMLGRAPVLPSLERLFPGRNELETLQTQRLRGNLRHNQMSVMYGIERPAENTDHPALTLRVWKDRPRRLVVLGD